MTKTILFENLGHCLLIWATFLICWFFFLFSRCWLEKIQLICALVWLVPVTPCRTVLDPTSCSGKRNSSSTTFHQLWVEFYIWLSLPSFVSECIIKYYMATRLRKTCLFFRINLQNIFENIKNRDFCLWQIWSQHFVINSCMAGWFVQEKVTLMLYFHI
jgi:hypothetical protein